MQVSQTTFDNPQSGELAGSTSAAQMPNVPCKAVCIKAIATNAGKVYVGFASGITKKTGSTNTTAGFELIAGECTPWIPVANLNKLWRICDNAGDNCVYIALS